MNETFTGLHKHLQLKSYSSLDFKGESIRDYYIQLSYLLVHDTRSQYDIFKFWFNQKFNDEYVSLPINTKKCLSLSKTPSLQKLLKESYLQMYRVKSNTFGSANQTYLKLK